MTQIALVRALELIGDGTLTIDSSGRIWRHRSDAKGGRCVTYPRRAESTGGKGYLRLALWIKGSLHGVGAHRVVWSYVNGPIPPRLQINHIDMDKCNNAPSNLELVTGSENIRHSYSNGRTRPWSRTSLWRGRPKLSTEQIAEARRLRSSGALLRDIAARFGIGTTHASRITS